MSTLSAVALCCSAAACKEESPYDCSGAVASCGPSADVATMIDNWVAPTNQSAGSIGLTGVPYCSGGAAPECRAVCPGESVSACVNGSVRCVDVKTGQPVALNNSCVPSIDGEGLERSVRLQAYLDFNCRALEPAPGTSDGGELPPTAQGKADLFLRTQKLSHNQAAVQGCQQGPVTYTCVGPYDRPVCTQNNP